MLSPFSGQTPTFSQRAVAATAGVSQMTVSRVLRGDGRVAAATVARVRAAVQEVGYVANPLVTALMRSRRRPACGAPTSLAVAWHGVPSALRRTEREKGLDDPYADILAGATEVLGRHGCRLDRFPMQPGDQRLPRILRARGVSGILLAPIGPGRRRSFGASELEELPAVHILGEATGAIGQNVGTDTFGAMQLCLSALAKAGCRHIGFIDSGRHQQGSGDRWLGAFLASAFRDLQLMPPELSDFRRSEAQEHLFCYLHKYSIDGLVVGSRTLLQILAEQKERLTNGVAFVALECGGWPAWISGARTDFRALGGEAAQLLVQQILSPALGRPDGRSLLVVPQWHEGQSHWPPARGRSEQSLQ